MEVLLADLTKKHIVTFSLISMLLEKEVEEIGARVVFDERQKHDSNSPINLDLNEEVIMWLFVRSTGNNSIVTQS